MQSSNKCPWDFLKIIFSHSSIFNYISLLKSDSSHSHNHSTNFYRETVFYKTSNIATKQQYDHFPFKKLAHKDPLWWWCCFFPSLNNQISFFGSRKIEVVWNLVTLFNMHISLKMDTNKLNWPLNWKGKKITHWNLIQCSYWSTHSFTHK